MEDPLPAIKALPLQQTGLGHCDIVLLFLLFIGLPSFRPSHFQLQPRPAVNLNIPASVLTSSVFMLPLFGYNLYKIGKQLLQMEYVGHQRSKKQQKRKSKKEIKIEAQTIDFPPTFSTVFPPAAPTAPRYYERVALAWRRAWQGTQLLSASTGKREPPPPDTISHGSC